MKKPTEPTTYNEINHFLDDLICELKSVLNGKLVAVYLYGSLVSGDFDYQISDIDLLVVCNSDIDKSDFESLDLMHIRIVDKYKIWHDRVEIVYASKHTLASFKKESNQIAVISPGEPFNTKTAETDWLMNWYLVQETSKTLLGPEPHTIIEPITQSEYISAVKEHARHWREWVSQTKDSLGFQSYAVLTICRALYTIEHGIQTSKPKSAKWAQTKFPQWSKLINDAMIWRSGKYDVKIDIKETYLEVVKFVNQMLDDLT